MTFKLQFVDGRVGLLLLVNHSRDNFSFLLTCVVQMPRVRCGRHWRDGERWRPAVRLYKFALVRHPLGSCRCSVWLSGRRRDRGLRRASQRRLEGGDSVELDPRQAAHEAWGVVTLDEDWVYVSSLCAVTKGGEKKKRVFLKHWEIQSAKKQKGHQFVCPFKNHTPSSTNSHHASA